MIQYILSYRCIMDPTTVCLGWLPPSANGGSLFIWPCCRVASCFNDRNPSPQALIPGEPTRTVCRILGNNSPPFFFCINPRSLDFSKVVNPAVPPRLFALLD